MKVELRNSYLWPFVTEAYVKIPLRFVVVRCVIRTPLLLLCGGGTRYFVGVNEVGDVCGFAQL